ncbi:MAG: hypothetical protein H0A76_05125 [Candidatus Thiodubiliella endoseptemdiera]|uniref:Uncharacterized protein n=1 Tax=Candidatus Thiodubiliella endoseptemdiera TaxID=2738886 RepID=A0A853F6F0_9GAMM|nr:hypothetical protein [Candidatus Thiodubiliella endoseptemdiera]
MIDLYSRKVAGWSMGKNNDTALVIDARDGNQKTSQDNSKYYCIQIKVLLTGLMSI